ncbi:hypothetical protein DFH09DRAFT_1330171 [Mycena vulgaris]|nr:hypothetical protein DFH09DRAFT_1330171 [Mycena vulgaris]
MKSPSVVVCAYVDSQDHSTITEIDVLSVSAYGSGIDQWFSAPIPESTSTSSVLQLTPTSVQTITPLTATDPLNPPPTELHPPPPPTTPDAAPVAAPLTEPASPTPARTPPHAPIPSPLVTAPSQVASCLIM